MVRTLIAVSTLAIMVPVAFATEAGARGAQCRTWSPTYVQDSFDPDAARKAPVVFLRDSATEKHPIKFEFDVGFAFHATWDTEPIREDIHYFNFQIDSQRRRVGLYLRTEWPTPSISDLDTYLYNEKGKRIAWSEWFNIDPIDQMYRVLFPNYYGGHGGAGYESMLGFEVEDCAGVTYEVYGSRTLGEKVTVKAWLGRPRQDW